jgi:long-chain acyl-CoA synthetase
VSFNVATILRDWVKTTPETVLLHAGATTWTYREVELTLFQRFTAGTVGGQTFDYRAADITLGTLPLCHVFGLASTRNVVIRHGGSAVLVPRFSGDDLPRGSTGVVLKAKLWELL